MSTKRYNNLQSDDPGYRKGYSDGMKAAFEESELDAYYAGVGFGKKAAGVKHIGFSSPEERASFEKGIEKKDKHFNSYRAEPPTFWERVLGVKETKKKIKRSRRSAKKSSKVTAKIQKRRTKYKAKVNNKRR